METECTRCGTSLEDVRFRLCEGCRLAAQESQRKQRAKRRDESKCHQCRKPRKESFSLCETCLVSAAARQKERRQRAKDAGLCQQCRTRAPESGKSYCDRCRENWNEWRAKNADRVNAAGRETARRVREDVISAYGGKCSCCGEHRDEFLALDHVNGDGAKERKEANGSNLYYRVRRENYPDRYRILCHNCNFSLFRYGYCPHQNKQR